MEFQILNSSTKCTNTVLRKCLIGAAALNQELGVFDYGNVLIRKDYTECPNVRIISGSGFYLGDLVGNGMLTVAIQGDEFAAPASNIILRTLHEMSFNHTMGSFIIIPCDSGNSLNFGLATERAVNDGLRIKMLTVADNYYNPQQPNIKKQAFGGIVLLYKIAGAMSNEMKSLTEIYQFCQELRSYIVSCEIELPPAGILNPDLSFNCTDEDHINISEKPSITAIKVNLDSLINVHDIDESIDEYRSDSRKRLQTSKLSLENNDSVVILINNNMTLSKLEICSCMKDIVEYLTALKVDVVRVYVGDFIKKSLSGLSLTIMKVINQNVLLYLDAHCTAPGWLKVNQGEGPLTTDVFLPGLLEKTTRLESPIKGPQLSDRANNILLFCMQFACSALSSCEKQLNLFDENQGKANGSTGTRIKRMAELIIKRLKQDKIVLKYPFTFFDNMSKLLEKSLGGCSGCMYSIMFEAAAKVFANYTEDTEVTVSIWLEAFEAATEAVKRYGHNDYGDGTMYDPLYAFCKFSRAEFQSDSDPLIIFGVGLQKAEETIELTKKDTNYPNAGAHAVGIWMRAIYEGVKVRWPN